MNLKNKTNKREAARHEMEQQKKKSSCENLNKSGCPHVTTVERFLQFFHEKREQAIASARSHPSNSKHSQ